MKQIKLFHSILLLLCCMALPSCSDNQTEPATPAAKLAEGKYLGDMDCSVMGNVDTFENKTFTITATDESTVTVALPVFGEAPMAMPSIIVDNVKITESNGIITLATTEVTGQTDSGKNYTCTLSGKVENNILDIKFNLQYGAMPMPMICSSKATRQ